jgi:hypothetical protein
MANMSNKDTDPNTPLGLLISKVDTLDLEYIDLSFIK